MRVMLRSDKTPDILISIDQDCIKNGTWEACSVDLLEQHIRTLNNAKKWLLEQQAKAK